MLSAYKKESVKKIGKLSNDSSHWSGLENKELEEDLNSFISKVRKLYYKGNKSFKQFMSDIEELADELAETYSGCDGRI